VNGISAVEYLARSLSVDTDNERMDDVFSLEFQNRWEAREARQAAELAAGMRERPTFGRRSLARGLAAVSRGTALAVRRLDDVVADDLNRSLSTVR
jgi:hypothetical protein